MTPSRVFRLGSRLSGRKIERRPNAVPAGRAGRSQRGAVLFEFFTVLAPICLLLTGLGTVNHALNEQMVLRESLRLAGRSVSFLEHVVNSEAPAADGSTLYDARAIAVNAVRRTLSGAGRNRDDYRIVISPVYQQLGTNGYAHTYLRMLVQAKQDSFFFFKGISFEKKACAADLATINLLSLNLNPAGFNTGTFSLMDGTNDRICR